MNPFRMQTDERGMQKKKAFRICFRWLWALMEKSALLREVVLLTRDTATTHVREVAC
jgi:hypothetical protein